MYLRTLSHNSEDDQAIVYVPLCKRGCILRGAATKVANIHVSGSKLHRSLMAESPNGGNSPVQDRSIIPNALCLRVTAPSASIFFLIVIGAIVCARQRSVYVSRSRNLRGFHLTYRKFMGYGAAIYWFKCQRSPDSVAELKQGAPVLKPGRPVPGLHISTTFPQGSG
jgi:hypothetical protein